MFFEDSGNIRLSNMHHTHIPKKLFGSIVFPSCLCPHLRRGRVASIARINACDFFFVVYLESAMFANLPVLDDLLR